jgi:glutathione S-transferase
MHRLYSFRRCPYAIRARIALHSAEIVFETIEVDLKNKPAALLACSPKGTVPVLQLSDGSILEESVDIVHWALSCHYPAHFLPSSAIDPQQADHLYKLLHTHFIPALNRYKYPNRYPGTDPQVHHGILITVMDQLPSVLQLGFFCGAQPSYLDILWFPFIRQYARIDPDAFHKIAAGALLTWFSWWEEQDMMRAVMYKAL